MDTRLKLAQEYNCHQAIIDVSYRIFILFFKYNFYKTLSISFIKFYNLIFSQTSFNGNYRITVEVILVSLFTKF